MKRVAAFGLAAALLGCSPHKITKNPPPPVPMPEAYTVGTGGNVLPEQWWADFGDPTLQRLVAEALQGNLQLRAAWARVAQARALVTQARSGMFPQVDLSASASRQKNRFNFQQEITVENNAFSASLAANYEVDLWRRMANQGEAAAMDALAVRDDVEAIAISLAAEVTEAYFDLISQRAQKKLIEQQLQINQTYLELVELRFQKGLVSGLDVYQQRQQLVTTRARLGLIDSTMRVLEHRLALLTGKPPRQMGLAESAPEELPTVPGLPSNGLPADLLERRPDVRAARRRVEAADYRVAVAVADRLPAIRLRATAGLQSATLADFIAAPIWSIAASLAAPIFDAGRRKAEVERTKAVVEERLMSYGQVLLQAMAEVENALVLEQQQLAYIAELEEGVVLATATLREAQERYRQGLVDYLPVLSALQGEQQAQINLLQARRQLLSYRVQLCRALGGTWTQALSAPEREGRSS